MQKCMWRTHLNKTCELLGEDDVYDKDVGGGDDEKGGHNDGKP